jgi:hypothetical protein
MKLNLGCGHDHKEGYVNVDVSDLGKPDMVVDLEVLPWPWQDSSIDEILIKHTLEHLGQTPKMYLDIMSEFWRICKNDATITVIVPHHRHDHFVNDPTHVRAITPGGLELFSQKKNLEWIDKGMGNSPLGLSLGIDFDVQSATFVPDQPWRRRLEKGEMNNQQFAEAAQNLNNVVVETHVVLKVIKPATSATG